jgi:TnpA family transposase
MADAAKLSYERLAWAAEWYLRTDTLEAATAKVLSYQLAQPITAAWGDLSRSSSDGQRFTVPVASASARWLPRYFGPRHQGLSIYTWTADRWAQFASRVVSSSVREATVVLDGILDNALELRPGQHSTDTAGWTDIVFALFDLLGMTFAPRLRDLGDIKLYRLAETTGPANAGPLFSGKVDLDLGGQALGRLGAHRSLAQPGLGDSEPPGGKAAGPVPPEHHHQGPGRARAGGAHAVPASLPA